ncbi:MAG TPA: nuclear pore complex subunit [Microscillaceae bacterium]|nr:nuclear pore complex subunit [Microscillaceae bacterium]
MLDNIRIKATAKTPEVSFNYDKGELEIIGRSIPENSYQFYEQLLSWLDTYATAPKDKTTVVFKLEYFNTSSSMYILSILKKIEKIYNAGYATQVKWFYESEDEDMLQTGEDLRQVVKMPVEMIEIDENA